MKRYHLILPAIFSVMICAAWGFKGHRAVATIAQKHLTSNTAYIVSSYLKGQSMADVSTWADENRTNTSAPWHFLNLPLGLSHDQFVTAVTQSDNNVYTSILKAEAELKDNTLTANQKNEALKNLIHFVGDAHQPMHVSRKEDKGGNTIQVQFDNQGTNLHALWDSKLIDHEGLNETDIAKNYDTATPQQIKQWQSDSPLEWLWESYQISSELYANTKPGQNIDDAYYNKYIPIIHKRIDQAGIRLAGELNNLFNNTPAPKIIVAPILPASIVKLEDIQNYVGKTVTVTGKIYSTKDIGSMLLANLGAAYPNQMLTLAIKGDAKDAASNLDGKTVTVTGQVINYKGKPEIVVIGKQQMTIQ